MQLFKNMLFYNQLQSRIQKWIRVKTERQQYFEGWYYKQQNEKETLAVIPAVHNGEASIQVITKTQAYKFDFKKDYELKKRKDIIPHIRIGQSFFSSKGFNLNIQDEEVQIKANIKYRNCQIPQKSVMGPFRHLWFMPCVHEVFNINNETSGEVTIQNGESKYQYQFDNAIGYIEGDKGTSFPEKYMWTQCGFTEGNLESIMMAIAELSVGKESKLRFGNFTGCTGIFVYKNREYHIATYLGAKVVQLTNDFVSIRQGRLYLEIFILDTGNENRLSAPVKGKMSRTIIESVSSTIRYKLYYKEKLIFDVEGYNAGYECEI